MFRKCAHISHDQPGLFEDLGVDALQDEIVFFGLTLRISICCDQISIVDIPIAKFMDIQHAFEWGKLLCDRSIGVQVHSPEMESLFSIISPLSQW